MSSSNEDAPPGDDAAAAERIRMMEIVINASPGLMAYWGRDLRCRFASKIYAAWFGLSGSDEIIGLSQAELLSEETYRLNFPLIQAVLAGEPQQFERDFVKPDGTVAHTLTHFVPDLVDGEVAGFTTHVTDVTLLKETELALRAEVADRQRANRIIRATNALLEEAQRLGRTGSWSWELARGVTHWSPEVDRIVGRDFQRRAPSLAETRELYAPEDWLVLKSAALDALRTGEPFRVDLSLARRAVAGPWRIEVRGEPFRDDDGHIIGLRGTARKRRTAAGPSARRRGAVTAIN